MDCTRRDFVRLALGASAAGLVSCGNSAQPETQEPKTPDAQATDVTAEADEVDLDEFEDLALSMDAWRHDEEHDVYYQLGIPYCTRPGSQSLESLAIFVPGPYLRTVRDDDEDERKAHVLELNPNTRVGAYTARTAPVLIPINSGTFAAQSSTTTYDHEGLAPYLESGHIYVYAGFRGRSAGYESNGGRRGSAYPGGIPWPVVDLKAVVRFLRYNASVLPGDMDRILTFGFSGGGGIASVVGASGDSPLFDPYLDEIGAATHDASGEAVSDAVFGCASWCPICSFDAADAAYEWMMGQHFTTGSRSVGTWRRQLSLDLAATYGAYLNALSLASPDEGELVLDESEEGVLCAGTYYEHLVSLVEDSATTFFAHTEFPYTYTPRHLVNASFPGDPNLARTGAGTTDIESVTMDTSADAAAQAQSQTYETDLDYVNALNDDTWWLTYNQRRGTAYVASLADFVRHHKVAAKDVCAFDAPDRSTVENQLFGVDDAGSLHFSRMIADRLVEGRDAYAADEEFDEAYVTDWTGDLTEQDGQGTSIDERVDMFDPLFFLLASKGASQARTVAPHWRVNSGLFQTDTSLCTEANLALALAASDEVGDVAFTPVWGQGHVLAEVEGTPDQNLLDWVATICA